MFRPAAPAGPISSPHYHGQQSAAELQPMAVALPLTGALPQAVAMPLDGDLPLATAITMILAVTLPQAAASGKARIMILKTKLQPDAQA